MEDCTAAFRPESLCFSLDECVACALVFAAKFFCKFCCSLSFLLELNWCVCVLREGLDNNLFYFLACFACEGSPCEMAAELAFCIWTGKARSFTYAKFSKVVCCYF